MNCLRISPLHILTLLIVLAGTTQLSAAPSDQNSSQIAPQIVGGEEAEPGAWPAMAAIVNANIEDGFNAQKCGGTVISPEWVLTAAHCFYNTSTNQLMRADEIDVILGRHLLSSNEGQRIDAIELILHPDHKLETNENDIGLIRLREAWDGEVMLLAQPSIAQRVEADNLPVTVIGWGARDHRSGDFVDALHQVTIPIVNNSICLEAMSPDLVSTSMMCAGLVEGGKDACKGDSGGPLMVSIDGYSIQVGIVSWGRQCARPNLYGVYTRVSDYFSWVEDQTGELAPLPVVVATAITLHKAAIFPVQSPSYLLLHITVTALIIMTLKLTNREQYANRRTK